MAEVFKSSKAGAPSGRNVDRGALQATLADLARAAGERADVDGASEATPGPAGHQALAALAAEVAQSSAVVEVEPELEPVADEAPPPARVSPVAAALRTPPARRSPDQTMQAAPPAASAAPTPLGSVPISALRPIGSARTGSPAPVDVSPAPEAGGLPAPSRLVPSSVRLPTKPSEATMTPDQPTIPLRRRAISDGPVSISQTPPTQAVETGSVGNGQAAAAAAPAAPVVKGASPAVVAWLPSDDDILPRRQMRRGRTFRRSR